MLGIFDSGSGGYNTLGYARRLLPRADIILLCDRKNAPYGTKKESEIRDIVHTNVQILTGMGCEHILIGCCTASSVFDSMEKTREVSSIIQPTANRARALSLSKKIAIIGTDATVKLHAFSSALPGCEVTEIATQPLVRMIDDGSCDGSISGKEKTMLAHLLLPLKKLSADTLILGCTHFGKLRESIKEIVCQYGITHIVDSAEIGASVLKKEAPKQSGHGMTYHLVT